MTATFTEDWFPESSCKVLADLVRSVADVPGLIFEVGAWEGRSTIAMANAAYPRPVTSVDTWAGSPGEISAELAAQRDVYATWKANIDASTRGNVTAARMGWREFVPQIDEPVALCFIDAEHTYDEVRDNIAAVRPLMAPGGVLCGDDVHHPPILEALFDSFGKFAVRTRSTVWFWRCPL